MSVLIESFVYHVRRKQRVLLSPKKGKNFFPWKRKLLHNFCMICNFTIAIIGSHFTICKVWNDIWILFWNLTCSKRSHNIFISKCFEVSGVFSYFFWVFGKVSFGYLVFKPKQKSVLVNLLFILLNLNGQISSRSEGIPEEIPLRRVLFFLLFGCPLAKLWTFAKGTA